MLTIAASGKTNDDIAQTIGIIKLTVIARHEHLPEARRENPQAGGGDATRVERYLGHPGR
ncbi:hypothetical protein [Bradyrhizobium jicamae]|uniref:hypothetical protein n=1 Tax=Bradyrhizobium jicamae TaxID=280332 RepID=UPI00070D4035|nr:hypothetical protein [Bradyrhizobium jicamae]